MKGTPANCDKPTFTQLHDRLPGYISTRATEAKVSFAKQAYDELKSFTPTKQASERDRFLFWLGRVHMEAPASLQMPTLWEHPDFYLCFFFAFAIVSQATLRKAAPKPAPKAKAAAAPKGRGKGKGSGRGKGVDA